MGAIGEVLTNKSLLCAVFAWFFSQVLKGIIYGLKEREWKISHFTGSGGTPSSHSAAVVAMALMVGFLDGFSSTIFAVCALFATIVIYDAMGVRRETGRQSQILNALLSKAEGGSSQSDSGLKEVIGHSPVEVALGVLIGVLCAMVAVKL